MNISAAVNQTIDKIPLGKIFGYQVFPHYLNAPDAVVRAVCRRVERQQLKRVAKGLFYTPRQGILGDVPLTDGERLQDLQFKNGRRVGYITGAALYNRLGLSTQIPKTITLATNRAAQTKDLGTIRIKLVPTRAPISNSTVPLLEILDVLRKVKKMQDADVGKVLKVLAQRLAELTPDELRKIQRLALEYYSAATRALLGVLLTQTMAEILPALRASINPTCRFNLGLDLVEWLEASAWNIRRNCTSIKMSAWSSFKLPQRISKSQLSTWK